MAKTFFQHQAEARRNTAFLVLCFVAAVLCIIAATYLLISWFWLYGLSGDAHRNLEGVLTRGGAGAQKLWNPPILFWSTVITVGIVSLGSAYKLIQLSRGGSAVATALGGRLVSPNTDIPYERRVLNVVEEMAIASGIPVPRVYILEQEQGINAFAAGFTPGQAVIGVTAGCATLLSRDELQGVIAHEFSHILNGDMRLNIRLMGLVHGILVMGLTGYYIFRFTANSNRRSSSKKGDGSGAIVLFGLGLMCIGYIGTFFGNLIKAAVSRQREFLADASAVQFTRNPSGIGGALIKIGGLSAGSKLATEHAAEASHMFFSDGLSAKFLSLLATHPPLSERIIRIDPRLAEEGHDLNIDEVSQQVSAEISAAFGLQGENSSSLHSGQASDSQPIAMEDSPFISNLHGQYGAGAKISVTPETLIGSVGTVSDKHVDYAARLLSAIPRKIADCVREPYGACAVVYALLLSTNELLREVQLRRLFEFAFEGIHHEVVKIFPNVLALRPEFRIPLVELALPTLKRLSPAQYELFRENCTYLIAADSKVSLFEYALEQVVLRHLDIYFRKRERPTVKFKTLKEVSASAVELMLGLAILGNPDSQNAGRAFDAGINRLYPGTRFDMDLTYKASLEDITKAVSKIEQSSAAVKEQVLMGCAACVAADGTATIEELELIRAISDALDCPMPPLVV